MCRIRPTTKWVKREGGRSSALNETTNGQNLPFLFLAAAPSFSPTVLLPGRTVRRNVMPGIRAGQYSTAFKFVMPGIRAVQYVRNGGNRLIGTTQLGLRVPKKRFSSYKKRFFLRKKLTPGRAEVICVNSVVFRPVDFHGRFYFFLCDYSALF